MNSSHTVGISAAGTAYSPWIDEFEKTLTNECFSLDIGGFQPNLIGCILVLGHDDDLAWLEEKLCIANAQGLGSLVMWASPAAPKRPHVWKWLLEGADYVCYGTGEQSVFNKILGKIKRWAAVNEALSSTWVKEHLVGNSPQWRSTLRLLTEIALFSDAPVLIMGESGTGKEMAAGLIHYLSKRSEHKKLCLLDCSAIAPDLSGSEFFGHEKGAFTNAVYKRDGAFADANGSTLFLDEVGELPMHLQTELLRVVQEGTFKRLGSNQWERTDFRLVSATNRDLVHCVAQHTFRTDLYYRISTWVCQLPPLKERIEDIPILAETFVRQLIRDPKERPIIDPWLMGHLCVRDYPGNVRELRQLLTRLVSRYTGNGVLSLADLPACDRAAMEKDRYTVLNHPQLAHILRIALNEGVGLKHLIASYTEMAKSVALEESGGNVQAAAELLQVSERTVQMFCSGKLNAAKVGGLPTL